MYRHSHLALKLSEVLPVLPEGGIAYRGDAARYSQGSLQRASGNYIIFTPQGDIEALATELQEGIDFALQFSYPEAWGENPLHSIAGAFPGYSAYYQTDQLALPALSWGTSQEGHLARVKDRGNVFYTPNSCIAVGSVAYDGPIIESANSSPAVATLDDIKHIEETIDMPNGRSIPGSLITRDNKKAKADKYLAGPGRPVFHKALGSVMAVRLVEAISREFGA